MGMEARTREAEAEAKTTIEERAAEAEAGRGTQTISMCGTTTASPATGDHPRQTIGGTTPARAEVNAVGEVAVPPAEVATATTSRGTPTFTPTTMTTIPGRSQLYEMILTIQTTTKEATAPAEEGEAVAVEVAPEEAAEEGVATEASGEVATTIKETKP